VAVISAGLLLAAGLAITLLPFARPGSIRSFTNADGVTNLSEQCSAPIISAWRSERVGGWFGYAPLAGPPPHFTWPACRPSARSRLAVAAALWFGAALVVAALRPPRATTTRRVAPA
jgi:hypothetical protein